MNGEFLVKRAIYKVLLFQENVVYFCFHYLSLFFVLKADLFLIPGSCILAPQHILYWNLLCYPRGLSVCNNQKLLFTQFPLIDE